MNFAIKHGMLHRDQNIALIILFQKKNKDPLNCSSYRPISLINSDVKILAKALVSRIEPLMDIFIHFDQTGFLRGRLAADNMRRLFTSLNILTLILTLAQFFLLTLSKLLTDLSGTFYGQYWIILVSVPNLYMPFKLFIVTQQPLFQQALISLYPFHYRGDVVKAVPYHLFFLHFHWNP